MQTKIAVLYTAVLVYFNLVLTHLKLQYAKMLMPMNNINQFYKNQVSTMFQ
jgi:hypothetical protein